MSALLALALAQLAGGPVPNPAGPIYSSPSLMGTSAWFEAFPASGAGTTGACSNTTPRGARGEPLTCTRATVVECYSNDGQTLTQLPVNVPAVSSGRVDSSWLGIWAEQSRDNEAVYSRDLSQAAWVKSSMDCAKTAIGMRNDANGASTCTASGAGGTVLQTLVASAATRTTSFHVKRRTGTGTVEVTRDNGSTWSDITASLSASLWKRVVPKETPGCTGSPSNCIVVAAMTSGGANPVFGFRLGTSGDAIDVDFVQDELGDEATSPIYTTTTWANRALTVCDFGISFSPTASTGFALGATQVSSLGSFSAGGTAVPLVLGGGTVGSTSAPSPYVWMYTPSTAGRIANDTSGVVSSGTASYDPFYSAFSSVEVRNVAFHTGAAINACQEGECAVGSASTLGTPAFTRILIGRYSGTAATQANAVIKGIQLDTYISGNVVPPATTGPVVWIGDSIVRGVGSLPLTPPRYLTALVGAGVVNAGVGSNTIASCGSRYNSTYAFGGYRTLVWSCAVNDMAAGTAGATAATAAQVYLADALSREVKVIVTGIMPWKNSSGWSAGKQTETEAYNSAMSTWAGLNGATYVSTDSMGGQGGDPALLLNTLDSGDDIHPNSAGAAALAALVNAATP